MSSFVSTRKAAITITGIVGLGLFLRLLALWHYGMYIYLKSDDMGYINSAIHLLQTGTLTYGNSTQPTVHMMPGISYLLAGVFALFGSGLTGMYAAKTVMIVFGTVSIYVTYRIGRQVSGPLAGLIGALLVAIWIPGIEMDNLLLTEPPFTLAFLLLVYYSIRLERERTWGAFWGIVVSYIAALFFRPTVALYPLILAAYLLAKHYPLGRLLRQGGIALVVLCIVLAPWWVRNYNVYHKFIPLDGGSGNPLLLGTYQGQGFPSEPALQAMIQQEYDTHPNVTPYQLSKIQDQDAKRRMSEWWHSNPKLFLKSYLWLKPQILWTRPFYWKPIFHFSITSARSIRPYFPRIGAIGLLLALAFMRKRRLEFGLISLMLIYYTLVYSIYFAYGRYSLPLLPYMDLGAGAGIALILNWIGVKGAINVEEPQL